MDPKTRRELHELLCALLDGTLDAGQQDRLGELLLGYPEARDLYLAHLDLHADLALRAAPADLSSPALPGAARRALGGGTPAEAPQTAQAAAAPQARAWSGRKRWGAVGLSAVAAGLVLAVILGRRPAGPTKTEPAGEPIDTTVAVLVQAPGAVWEDSALPVRPGAALQPGWLRLKSGFAHLEFYCGAIVILEGPAELRLISRTEAYCARGKLRATVPAQAKGFTVGMPKMDLVDRGTEFGLDVAPGGRTEVHVFQGEVDLHDAGADRTAKPQHKLLTGDGVRVDAAGVARPIRLDPAAFVTAEGLAARTLEDTRLREQKWLALANEWRADPALQVHYAFQADRPWSRTLPDRAAGRKERRDAAIVGCSWGPGRWPGKQGLEFKRVSDRVRLSVPGEFDSLTLMAWVRVDALPNKNNALFMSDGWEPGELHWQIGDSGTLILGVQATPKGKGAHYHAAGVLTPDRLGQWLHLAVVYDGDAEEPQVSHYVNGVLVEQGPVEFDTKLRVGDAELGNWNVAAHRNNTPIRFLSGCVDEFLLFSRPLGQPEIERHYAAGRPPS